MQHVLTFNDVGLLFGPKLAKPMVLH